MAYIVRVGEFFSKKKACNSGKLFSGRFSFYSTMIHRQKSQHLQAKITETMTFTKGSKADLHINNRKDSVFRNLPNTRAAAFSKLTIHFPKGPIREEKNLGSSNRWNSGRMR